MPIRSPDLHGNIPDRSNLALILIDVINDLEFEGGTKLFRNAKPMAAKLARLKARASAARIPTVYVNDNFGRWTSDFRSLVSHCVEDAVRGRDIAIKLVPDVGDYFVLKPKHSGFFSSTLELVLKYIGASKLIMGGLTTDICVLFTANDAYMRDYKLIVAADCVACSDDREHRLALRYMKRVLRADIRNSTRLDLASLARE
jgi:nicotinamidase-related amidase